MMKTKIKIEWFLCVTVAIEVYICHMFFFLLMSVTSAVYDCTYTNYTVVTVREQQSFSAANQCGRIGQNGSLPTKGRFDKSQVQ